MTASYQDLYLNLDLPEAGTILQKLEANLQQTRLHVLCTGSKQSVSQLPQLAGSSSVSFVQVEAEYSTAAECRELTGPLKQVLLSCPNLRHLSLNISPPRAGCVVPNPPSEYCGFGFSGGERLPPLESLEIIAYPWGREPNNSPINIHAIGYPEQGEELDYWAETFDWSHLCRFSDHSSDLGIRIAPKLTALQEISLHHDHNKLSLRSFLLNVPSMLSSITIPYSRDVGIDAILRHKTNLRRLKIHNPDLLYKPQAQELLQLRDSLLNLNELALDIDRADDMWPYSSLDLLASFPHLHRLELWFDLGHGSDAPARPYLTVSSARHLCEYMHDRSVTLQSLILHSGCRPQPTHGYPTDEVLWRAANTTSFTCDMVNQTSSLFTLTCSNLDAAQNEKIQSNLQSGEHRIVDFPKGQNVAFKVAIDGPLSMEDWILLSRKDQ